MTHPALADVRVRRALRFATNRPAILEKVERGHGYLSESIIGPQSPYALSIPPEPDDPKRAAALLDEAGWMTGADGIRQKNGTKLNLYISTITGSSERNNWGLLIQSWWAQVGIKTSIKHYPPSVLFGSYQEGGIQELGKYDVSMNGQGYGSSADETAILSCKQFPPGGFNTTRFCDPALDAVMAQLARTLRSGGSQGTGWTNAADRCIRRADHDAVHPSR